MPKLFNIFMFITLTKVRLITVVVLEQDFIYSTLADESTQALTGKVAWASVLDTVQTKVVAYAKKQGFTVK